METQVVEAFEKMLAISKEIYKTEALLKESRKTVEEAAKSVEKMIVQSQDISIVLEYATIVLGETLFWLSSGEQIQKERFICRYLPILSRSQKRDLMDSIRNNARLLYPDDGERQLSITFHAKDLLFDSFPIMRRR